MDINDELRQSLDEDMPLIDCTYAYNGTNYTVNAQLVKKRGLDQEAVNALKLLHCKRICILETMELVRNRETLYNLAEELTSTEYDMQELWGFERDHSYHQWWNWPRCTCPKMDNAERIGHPDLCIVNESCPLHWPIHQQREPEAPPEEPNSSWNKFTKMMGDFLGGRK